MKKLIPAFALLLVSAVLMSTASFAWFSMNTVVTANNMQIKAIADQGILINEVAGASDANWDGSANTTAGSAISLHATSTANTATWYVAHSKAQDDAAAATAGVQSGNLTSDGYKALGSGTLATAVENVAAVAGSKAAQAITYVDTGSTGYADGEGYYVKYTYYIKSSSDKITLSSTAAGQSFNIKSVTATPVTTTSADLDKALRVAIVINGKAYIFAPLYASDALPSYYVNAATTATTPLDHTASQVTALAEIPATNVNGTPVEVYLYFEGEDTNLKTSNALATLDNINVAIEFELATNTTTPTDHGVSIS